MTRDDRVALDASVSVVIVSYNSSDVLPDALRSIPRGIPVWVVDNGGEDAEALERLSIQYGFSLIRSDRNIGFGRACNLGCRNVDTEFVFFLNPDAVLAERAIEALVEAARRYPDAVAFNPLIELGPDRFLRKRKCRILPRRALAEVQSLPFEQDATLPVLSGAALMVRKAAFDAIGGFDPQIFLYFEDDDLSVRLRAAEGQLKRVAGAKVLHVGGQSSGASHSVMKIKNFQWARARVYVTRKHGMRFPLLGALSEAIRALRIRTRFGEVQPLSVRLSLLWGALSSVFDNGAYRG